MKRPWRIPLVSISLVLLPALAAAAPGDKAEPLPASWITTVRLLTIGPGDHLWTRFGHSALMVYRCPPKPGSISATECDPKSKKYHSEVYNYGDADFSDSRFEYEFMRGTVKFRISSTGSLSETVTRYARDNRTVEHQMLNLTPKKVAELVRLLEDNIKPGNRYYRYHHLTAGCATKIRDLLDKVLDGAVSRQFGEQLDPMTPRYYGREVFAGHVPAEVFNDLFMGRLHDRKWNKYEAMCVPYRMAEYLAEVRVPDPAGGDKTVSLLGKTSTLFKRRGKPATVGEGRTLIHLMYLGILVTLVLGVLALLGVPQKPRRAGVWLLLWAGPMGLYAIIAMIGALASTVIEGRVTEWMLVFPITDLALVGVGIRWLKGTAVAGPLLRGYALVRLALVVIVGALHATGLLLQEPRAILVLALVNTLLLVLVTRRLPNRPPYPDE